MNQLYSLENTSALSVFSLKPHIGTDYYGYSVLRTPSDAPHFGQSPVTLTYNSLETQES